MTEQRKKLSMREKARLAGDIAVDLAKLQTLYAILSAKNEAIERLLAAHHGSEVVTEEQIKLCMTCRPLCFEAPKLD